MAKESQSQFALLGLLSFRAMSGYDLKQLSEWSVGHFWREGYGQIYPTLKKMAADGLVSRKTEQTSGRPDRHVYALTNAGRQELEAWLRKPPAEDVPRNEFLLKVFFGGLAPKGVSRKHVEEHRSLSQESLAIYKATRKRIEKEAGKHPQKPFWLMTLSYGEYMSRAAIKWCDKALKDLR